MAAWRCEISLLVLKKYFTRSLRSLVKYFSTREEKSRISARPCNILSIYHKLDFLLNKVFFGTSSPSPNHSIQSAYLFFGILDNSMLRIL